MLYFCRYPHSRRPYSVKCRRTQTALGGVLPIYGLVSPPCKPPACSSSQLFTLLIWLLVSPSRTKCVQPLSAVLLMHDANLILGHGVRIALAVLRILESIFWKAESKASTPVSTRWVAECCKLLAWKHLNSYKSLLFTNSGLLRWPSSLSLIAKLLYAWTASIASKTLLFRQWLSLKTAIGSLSIYWNLTSSVLTAALQPLRSKYTS